MRSPLSWVLREKGTVVHTIPPTASVNTAVSRMAEHGIGSVVVKEGPMVLGLVTEREVLLRVVGEARDPRTTSVGEIMIPRPAVAAPSTTVVEAMSMMTECRTRHLPVVDGIRLVGLVSIGDLTRWLTRDLADEVDRLECYIRGAYA